MYRDAYDEVVRLGLEVLRRDGLTRQLAAAQAEVRRLRDELSRLESTLSNKQRELGKLEGSVPQVLRSLVGKAGQRLDDGRREVLEARLRVEATAGEVESAQREVSRLQIELGALEGIDEAYRQAFSDKVGRLLHSGGETAQRLEGVIAEATEGTRLLQGIDGAIDAGIRAERHLAAAMGNLETSTGSTYGRPLHRLNLREARRHIGRYARELAQIPGWGTTAAAVARHADLLRPLEIVAGGRSAATKKCKHAIRRALKRCRHARQALQKARPAIVARRDDALRRYREAVERA